MYMKYKFYYIIFVKSNIFMKIILVRRKNFKFQRSNVIFLQNYQVFQ